jgi:hypothetical protein
MVRGFVVLAGLLTAMPAVAGEMRAEDARRFVVGKLFAYNCFEGTRGAGRINADGSLVGSIQFRGGGPVRYAAMPAGTIRVKGASVCAAVKGMPFEPCFNLQQTSEHSFRGTIHGLGFAYCDFTRRNARVAVVGNSTRPLSLQASAAGQ